MSIQYEQLHIQQITAFLIQSLNVSIQYSASPILSMVSGIDCSKRVPRRYSVRDQRNTWQDVVIGFQTVMLGSSRDAGFAFARFAFARFMTIREIVRNFTKIHEKS